jgi:DNA-directed RNA polymerase alpha subunit
VRTIKLQERLEAHLGAVIIIEEREDRRVVYVEPHKQKKYHINVYRRANKFIIWFVADEYIPEEVINDVAQIIMEHSKERLKVLSGVMRPIIKQNHEDLDRLKLPVKVHNILMKETFNTLEKISQLTRAQLLAMEGMYERDVREVVDKMKAFGYIISTA